MIRTWHIVLLLFSSLVHAETYSLVVQGLGGTRDFENAFTESAHTIAASVRRLSTDPDNHVFLSGEQANRSVINQNLERLSATIRPQDTFVLTLVGHGSFDGKEFKFNVPGPDVSGEELAMAMSSLPAKNQLLVVASSSSGAIVDLLEEEGRTIITATKSGRERHAVMFPAFWAEAMTSESADLNKDELLSVAEAFQFATRRVEKHYKSKDLLATEHSRLIDNTSKDFYLARSGRLTGTEGNAIITSLLEQRSELAEAFYRLKDQKESLSEENYMDSLESTLLQLAKLQQSIDLELDRE